MKENKKITKKQIITMSIGVSILIVLAITATYAFFRFENSNAFGTSKITGKTPSSDASSVVLENINDELTININTEDMLQTNGNTTYWASPEGKKTSETINQIGKAKAMVEGTYTCNYTMTIEDKATDSIYNAFQLMSTKSNNQIVLTVNEETYDFNTSNLFPITYNGILEGITQSDYQYITASMYIKNEQEIDQTQLSDKDIDIEFKVTELKCTNNEFLPEITNFEIGEREELNSRETILYLEWNNDNIESYCINTEDRINNCTWENTESNNGETIEYTLTGNVGDSITLYAFTKDNLGNIGRASDTVTLGEIKSGANYIISLADQPNTNVITQTHDTGTDGTAQTGHNTDTDYRYIGSNPNNYVCLGNTKVDGTCIDEDHLYRVIGVIPTQTTKTGGYENRIKLIKSTEYLDDSKVSSPHTPSGYGYYWTGQSEEGDLYNNKYTSYSGSVNVNPNNWEESTLNRKILNQTYYNSLEEEYQNMIGNSVWYLGGREDSGATSSVFYNTERSETKYGTNPTYGERKIGLIYSSDYGYATSGESTTNRATCLTTNLSKWNANDITYCKDNDWLSINGYYQWTITPSLSYSDRAFFISINNGVYEDRYVYMFPFVIRPTFCLNTNVNIISGNGSISSPYTLGQ